MKVPELHWIEYFVIVAYLVFLALIGPMMRKFNANSDDYFRGGARGKWWLLGPSLSLSMTSATVYTGVTGAIYEAGLAPLASNVGQWVAGGILIAFLAAWFRRLRFVTAAEAIRQRFGPITEQFYAYLHMLMSPMYGAFQLLGLSMFASVVFQFPLPLVVIGLGVVVAIYSTSGGRWAVMATDFIQALVLLPVIAAVCILTMNAVGGVPSLLQQLGELEVYQLSYSDGAYPDGSYTMPWILAMFFVQFIMQLNIGFNARFFSAKDGVEAKKAAMLMTIMMIVGTICYTLPALASRVLYADQVASFEGILNKPAEASFVVTCLNLMPVGLMGMVLVAMFSATASSMDTGLNTNAAIIVRNILPPIRRWMKRPSLDADTETVWGKGTTLLLSVITIGLTLWIANFGQSGIFELIINFGAAVNLPMGLPFFLVLLFPTAPRNSAILSISTGLVIPWLVMPLLALFEIRPDYDERVAIITGCTLFGFFVSYLLPNRESERAKAETADFHANMRRPVDFETEVGRQNDDQQLLVLGRMSLILSAGILCLLVVPNPIDARGVILMVASVSGIVGIAFTIYGRHLQRRSKLRG